MKKLKLFLVAGFLGSGKTTAIQQAAMYLRQNNRKVGVITNDQGSKQVDNKFIKGYDIATEEVADGCFCCNFNELASSIESLKSNERPEIIFAESVGSCADLAATIINPLLSFNPGEYQIVLSVFADIRLLVQFLQNDKNIFYDNVNYIYGKQLEEADIIVVNKVDLPTEEQMVLAKQLIEKEYGGKLILYQNSLSPVSVKEWLTFISDEFENTSLRTAIEIDYDIYAAGEAELAWLDEEIGIVTDNDTAVVAAYMLMTKIYNKIIAEGYPIGHLKFLLDNGEEQQKISYTTIPTKAIDNDAYAEKDRVIILINARVQVIPKLLQKIVEEAIIETEVAANCKIIAYQLSAFQPGYPLPTHRISNV